MKPGSPNLFFSSLGLRPRPSRLKTFTRYGIPMLLVTSALIWQTL